MKTENNYDLIRSPLLRRLAEVLETLKFKVSYVMDDNVLVLPDYDCIFFERHLPDPETYWSQFKKESDRLSFGS